MQQKAEFYHKQKLNPAIKDLCVNPQDYYLFTEPNFVPFKPPWLKTTMHFFHARNNIGGGNGCDKGRFSPTLIHEQSVVILTNINKKFQKKNEKQSN
jgi:hypothetical protein